MRAFFANLQEFFRRWPYSVTCAAVALVLGGASAYWWFLHLPTLRESLTRRTEETELTDSKMNGRAFLEQRLAEVKIKTAEIESDLVDADNLASNLGYFYRIEEETKTQLKTHQLDSPALEKAGEFRRVPYSLRVQGSFEQIASFIFMLETGKRMGRVTSFNLSRADAAAQVINLDLNVELLGKK
jgi:Tfp pilus assembly protein PilO